MPRYLILALALFTLAGCSTRNKEKQTPLAEVNGEVLTLEGFRSTFSDEEWNKLSPEQKKQQIEDWVNVTLLAQAADEQKLGAERSVRQRMDYAVKKIKANALIASRLASIDIGEEELFNYYRIHRSEFQSKLLEYDVQRILTKDASTADILLKRLREGYDFNTAVSEQSQEILRDKLGRMGFVAAAGKDSLFWRAAHSLKENDPGVVSIEGATYILRYTGQREGSQDANFNEYRDEIRQILLREKQKQVYEDILRQLKTQENEIYYY
jgi:hypothetical protein